MSNYYNFIKHIIFGEEDFEKLINNEPIEHDEEYTQIDVSSGSGFHARVRGRYRSKLGQ